MRANFYCLNEGLARQRRYFSAWITLMLCGCLAFALGESGVLAALSMFVIMAFAVTLWPACAAFQSDCDRSGQPRKKAKS